MKILTTIAAALLAGCATMGPTRLVMEADWRVAIDDLASIPCSEEGPACAFVKDYVRSGYSDA